MPNAQRILSGAGVAIVVALLMASAVLADGLPTPLPGATTGPETQSILDIAGAYHLDCQSTSAPGVPPESFCLRPGSLGDLIFNVSMYENPTLVAVASVSGSVPFTDEADDFLRDIAAQFCTASQRDALTSFLTGTRTSPPPPGEQARFDDPTCHLDSSYFNAAPNQSQSVTNFSTIGFAVATPSALPTTAPSPTPQPTKPPTTEATAVAEPTNIPSATPAQSQRATPAPAPVPPAGSDDQPTAFVESVPAPSAVSTDPLTIAASAGLAALIVLLMPFPAQLFNSTLESNYDEVRRWFRLDSLERAAGRFGGFWNSPAGIVVFVLLASLIYAFLDPGFSFDIGGLAVLAGLALGIVAVTLLAAVFTRSAHAKATDKGRIRVLPATLLVGLVCVLLSRVTGFLPGYVYGIVLGFVFARSLSRIEEGRANALAAAFMLTVALVAWVVLAMVVSSIGGPLGILLTTLLATLVVAGLEGVVFGLLPFRFLAGEPIYATRRLVWAVLLGIGAFCFFHILINPASGYLSSSSRTPLLTIVALFVGFGVVSVAFWAYFRKRPAKV